MAVKKTKKTVKAAKTVKKTSKKAATTPAKKKAAAAKKAPAKKAPVKKAAAKTTAKKAAPKPKAAAAKKAVKKTTAKKTVAKNTASNKKAAPAKKAPAVKKAAPKKATTKKASPVKKATVKKTAPKKASATKKAATKKAAASTQATAKPKESNSNVSVATPDQAAPAFKPYVVKRSEDYMNDGQKEHFREILNEWKSELMEEVDRTVMHMKDEASNFPDPADRASQEEEFSLELRTRDRERKLIKKIDSTIELIGMDEYGYCEACGVEIGIQRLEARPTASLCIDCKTLSEIKERQERG